MSSRLLLAIVGVISLVGCSNAPGAPAPTPWDEPVAGAMAATFADPFRTTVRIGYNVAFLEAAGRSRAHWSKGRVRGKSELHRAG